MPAGMFAIFSFLLLMVLAPFIFIEVMLVAFFKLGIPPFLGALIIIAIFIGSLVNIPIKRTKVKAKYQDELWMLFGLKNYPPQKIDPDKEQVIAINLGGAVIPLIIVAYEILRLFSDGAYFPLLIAIIINVIVCYLLSQSWPGVGVVLPAFVPGIIAAFSGLVLYPENPPAVAFCAGVLGPVIGADLMRLREMSQTGADLMSIGGAGTFDGIVISGILAVLLS